MARFIKMQLEYDKDSDNTIDSTEEHVEVKDLVNEVTINCTFGEFHIEAFDDGLKIRSKTGDIWFRLYGDCIYVSEKPIHHTWNNATTVRHIE